MAHLWNNACGPSDISIGFASHAIASLSFYSVSAVRLPWLGGEAQVVFASFISITWCQLLCM